jgi:3-phosphoshikimate 1-carboxyvinyltransferase
MTARLLLGVLAAQPFESTLTCTGRPGNPGLVTMANALVRMGAEVLHSETAGGFEVKIKGAELIGQSLVVQEPDGAVKAALLFAGVLAHGVTTVTERSGTTVDHAERLLRAGGINVTGGPDAVRLVGGQRPRPLEIELPGDLSAAACCLAFAACRRGSRLILRNVCLNRQRLGFLTVLLRMGARIREEVIHCGEGEWHGILDLRGADLRPVVIDLVETPALMEHAPLLAIVAAMAKGISTIRGLSAWREQDPDRVRRTFSMLRSMGVRVEKRQDRMAIHGEGSLRGGRFEPSADPRLAMTHAVAAALAHAPSRRPDANTLAAVDPDFWRAFDRVVSHRFGPP